MLSGKMLPSLHAFLPLPPAQEGTLLGVCTATLRSAEGADPPLSPGDVTSETPERQNQCKLKGEGPDATVLESAPSHRFLYTQPLLHMHENLTMAGFQVCTKDH